MRRRLPLAFSALLLALQCGTAAAQMRVEVIPLQHRMANDVIPVLQPLLAQGGSVTGMNNQLILKTTPENLAEIRAVLDNLDQRLRQLQISVRQDADQHGDFTRQSVAGRMDAGDVSIRQGRGAGPDGVTVGVGDREVHVQYQRRDRSSDQADHGSYQVRTLEGQPAFIQTGQAIPIPQRIVAAHNGTLVVQDSVEYHNADAGFWVLPRVHGDQVTLMISPYTSRVGPGPSPEFDVQRAETTVSGQLGQWIAIAGIDQSTRRSSRELLSGTSEQLFENRNIQVRVDEIE
jgi:type II secretory pathway component GspD/PulD (secretin)